MKRSLPSLRRILAATLAVGFLSAPVVARAADPYEINVIVPQTGSVAFLGGEEKKALEVLEASVNKTGGIGGRPLKFTFYDDQSNPQVSVQLASTIIAKKPAVFLGPSLVGACNAIIPLVKEGPVQYCFSPGVHPAAGTYAFSSSISTTDLLAASAVYFSARGLKKVAIITSTDATGQDAERTIDAAFGPNGTNGEMIVDREHFNTTDISVTAQMTRIAASGAQVVIAWSSGTPLATLLRGARDAGLTIPVMTGDGNMTYQQMHEYKDILPKELYIAAIPAFAPPETLRGPVRDAVRAYVDAFKTEDIRPDIGQSLAWEPGRLVIEALRKLGPNTTAEQLRAYLNNLKGVAGINGVYDFTAVPQRGIAISSVIVTRWDPEKDTWVPVSEFGGKPKK